MRVHRPDPMADMDALLDDDVADIGRDVLASMGITSPVQRTDLGEGGEPERASPPEEKLAAFAEEAIASFQQTTGMELAPTQKEAVRMAMRSKVMILTGGPGTGKSATSRAILYAFASAGFDISLCAPTGKAAKRLKEATGFAACTIHRLLGYKPDMGFQYRAGSPLPRTAVLVDEASMCDVQLFANLLDGLHDGARLVIVGDVDQLPSVGPGAVLRDLIDSGIVPTIRLDQIFRQAQGSQIIVNAHRVNRGLPPVNTDDKDSDFFFIPRTEAASALATTLKIITERLERRGISTRDCMVISPQKRGKVGVDALNESLQAVLNPAGRGLVISERHGITWREGDPVMQTKNDYEREVFNGETGCINQVDPERNQMLVKVDAGTADERAITYERKHFDNVALAYACTVHKSQGSQMKAVIVIMLNEHYRMLSRALLYTALTRGEKLVVLIADPKAIAIALSETRREVRDTGLRERLRLAHGEGSDKGHEEAA
jgi:exodeoxyribonuclease V alpha subunit